MYICKYTGAAWADEWLQEEGACSDKAASSSAGFSHCVGHGDATAGPGLDSPSRHGGRGLRRGAGTVLCFLRLLLRLSLKKRHEAPRAARLTLPRRFPPALPHDKPFRDQQWGFCFITVKMQLRNQGGRGVFAGFRGRKHYLVPLMSFS